MPRKGYSSFGRSSSYYFCWVTPLVQATVLYTAHSFNFYWNSREDKLQEPSSVTSASPLLSCKFKVVFMWRYSFFQNCLFSVIILKSLFNFYVCTWQWVTIKQIKRCPSCLEGVIRQIAFTPSSLYSIPSRISVSKQYWDANMFNTETISWAPHCNCGKGNTFLFFCSGVSSLPLSMGYQAKWPPGWVCSE